MVCFVRFAESHITETEGDMDDLTWARNKLDQWLLVIWARIEMGMPLPQDMKPLRPLSR